MEYRRFDRDVWCRQHCSSIGIHHLRVEGFFSSVHGYEDVYLYLRREEHRSCNLDYIPIAGVERVVGMAVGIDVVHSHGTLRGRVPTKRGSVVEPSQTTMYI